MLTDEDESRSLEESLVVPVRMLRFENVADAVVFPKPDRGVHHEARDQTKGLMTYSKAMGLGHVWRIVHVYLGLTGCRRVHFTFQNLNRTSNI